MSTRKHFVCEAGPRSCSLQTMRKRLIYIKNTSRIFLALFRIFHICVKVKLIQKLESVSVRLLKKMTNICLCFCNHLMLRMKRLQRKSRWDLLIKIRKHFRLSCVVLSKNILLLVILYLKTRVQVRNYCARLI